MSDTPEIQQFYVFEARPLNGPRAHDGKHRTDCNMVRATDYDALHVFNEELVAASRLAVAVIGSTRDEFGLKLEAENAYLALRAAIAKADGDITR